MASEDSREDASRNVIIFLFGTTAIGALMRLALRDTSFPYTVAMILVGLVIGALTNRCAHARFYARSTSCARARALPRVLLAAVALSA